MYEIYYTGVIASMVGADVDLGLPVAMSLAALVYSPARYLELEYPSKRDGTQN